MDINRDWVRIGGDVQVLESPDQETFENHISEGVPAVIRDGFKQLAPCQKWSDAYLKKQLGDRIVKVRVSRTGTFKGGMGPYPEDMLRQVEMPFSEMMERMAGEGGHEPILCEGERYYLYQLPLEAIEPIRPDISTPHYVEKGDFGEVLYRVWISAAGNVTPAHTDTWVDNLLFQVTGEKTVLLWDPSQIAKLYTRPFGEIHSRESPVDMLVPEPDKFPEFLEASALRAVLKPGDMLLIPQAWLHYVYTDTAAINLSYWFNSQEQLEKSLAGVGEWLYTAPAALRQCYLHLLRWPESVLHERGA